MKFIYVTRLMLDPSKPLSDFERSTIGRVAGKVARSIDQQGPRFEDDEHIGILLPPTLGERLEEKVTLFANALGTFESTPPTPVLYHESLGKNPSEYNGPSSLERSRQLMPNASVAIWALPTLPQVQQAFAELKGPALREWAEMYCFMRGTGDTYVITDSDDASLTR